MLYHRTGSTLHHSKDRLSRLSHTLSASNQIFTFFLMESSLGMKCAAQPVVCQGNLPDMFSIDVVEELCIFKPYRTVLNELGWLRFRALRSGWLLFLIYYDDLSAQLSSFSAIHLCWIVDQSKYQFCIKMNKTFFIVKKSLIILIIIIIHNDNNNM